MKRDYRRSGRGRKRSSLAQQLRQLADVGGDAAGHVAGEAASSGSSPSTTCRSVRQTPHDEAFGVLLD
jgi:hypothetical protein